MLKVVCFLYKQTQTRTYILPATYLPEVITSAEADCGGAEAVSSIACSLNISQLVAVQEHSESVLALTALALGASGSLAPRRMGRKCLSRPQALAPPSAHPV